MNSLHLIYSDDLVSMIVNSVHRNLALHKKTNLFNGPIIDLGCGTGAILHELKARYPSTSVIGVDKYPREQYTDVSYLTSNITNTNLPSSSAQIVITVNLSDYLNFTFSQDSFFKEVDRLLIPGGVYLPLDLFREKLVYPFQQSEYKSFALDYQEKPFLQKPLSTL